ncbi:MAG: hypothetical protein ACI9E1_001845 [Cryomorphaceae bacterium]|jgi:hypothetical protein
MRINNIVILILCLCSVSWAVDSVPIHQTKIPHQVALRHPGIASNQPKEYTLFQIKNHQGLITGYTMVIDSVVCEEDVCEVVDVTMLWDAIGAFEGYTLEKGLALEKVETSNKNQLSGEKEESYKAAPFTDADDKKLHKILKDKHSLLKTWPLKSLAVLDDYDDDFDLVSRPTPPNFEEAVVTGAALTCFHIWHWANGDVPSKARNLTQQHGDKELLSAFLSSTKPTYVLFALKELRERKVFTPEIVTQINERMRSGNEKKEFDLGYAYLKSAIPDAKSLHHNLAQLFTNGDHKSRVHLLELLDSEEILPHFLIEKMALALPEMKDYEEIHMYLNLLEKHSYSSPSILKMTSQVLKNNNFFIARRAYWYLDKQTLDKLTSSHIQSFREKNIELGRDLQRLQK